MSRKIHTTLRDVRVVHLIARFNQGGTATWLVNLIEGQRAEGDAVWLIAGRVPPGEIQDLRFEKLGGLQVGRMSRTISPFNDLISLIQVRRLINEIRPDVINTHTAKAGTIGRIAAWSLGKNRPMIVHTYHGHVLYGYFGAIPNFIFKNIEKSLSKITDLILVSGTRVKEELLQAGIGREKQYLVVRPGISPTKKLDKRRVRQELLLSENAIVVGWLGRMAKIKRPDRVIDLARDLSDIEFLVGGDGELFTKMKSDLPPNLHMLGWVSPSQIWSASDIAILTSDNEAQPLSLIEAASLRIPLVGEDVGSVSEVIYSGKSGFLTHSHGERLQALETLAKNPHLRESMGEFAFEDYQNRFSMSQFINSHRKAYEGLVSERR